MVSLFRPDDHDEPLLQRALTCSVCLLSLECSTADTVAMATPGLISEGTRLLASWEHRNLSVNARQSTSCSPQCIPLTLSPFLLHSCSFLRHHMSSSSQRVLSTRSPSVFPQNALVLFNIKGAKWTHVRQDVDALVAASEGQVEYGAASVGHGRRLQLQHQVWAVGLGQGGLRVLLRTHHVEGLQETRQGKLRLRFTLIFMGLNVGGSSPRTWWSDE